MQDHSTTWDDALTGTVSPVARVDAWYDGELVAGEMEGVTGSVTVDATRLIAADAKITVAAPDASILPTSWRSALACYGTELHVQAGIRLPGGGTELMSLGWLRVDSFDAQESYQLYDATARLWVARGSQVDVDCSDRMALLDDADFLAPEQPEALTSVLDEISRLARDIVTVADLSDITDAAIPRDVTYSQSRSDAIKLIAGVLNYVPRMNPDGALMLYPDPPTGSSVWTVAVADDALPPVASWARSGSRDGLYNAVVSSGTDAAGAPIQGIATEDTGPLRYAGPFGRVPYFHDSPLLTTETACFADADTRLANLIAQRTVMVPVTLPANYALEVGDVITVTLPSQTLEGPVSAIAFTLGAATMQVDLAVPRSSIWGL